MSETKSPIWIAREGRATYNLLEGRSYRLALDVLKVCDAIPSSRGGNIIANQLGRAGTSVAANYRAARRARSRAEWIAKLGIAEEEADEVVFFTGLGADAGIIERETADRLRKEANEILAMIVASIKTSKQSKSKSVNVK